MRNSSSILGHTTMLTGVTEIDSQHQFLVDTLVDAKAELAEKTGGPAFDQITRDLLSYAIYHFETEEELMRRHGYQTAAPEAAALHLAEHRRFSERIVALRASAHLGEASANKALLQFLEEWLTKHILTIDKHLGRFICAATASPGGETTRTGTRE